MVSSQRSNDISNNRYNYKNMNSAEKVFSLELRKILTYIDTELLDEYTTKTITPTFFVFSLLNNKKCNAYKALSILSTRGRLDDVYNIFSMLMNEYIKITIPKKLRKRRKDDTNKPTYNNELSKYLFDAEGERDYLNNKFVGSEHVLLAILKDETSELSKIFSKININYEVFKGVFKNEKLEGDDDLKNEPIPTNSNDKRRGDNRKTTGKKGALEEYCTNLNDEAKNGKIDMLIGRENEVNRIIKVMSRRNKNNVVLVGLPGVGKTAIARGLTNLIEDRRASFLNDKVIMLLRTTTLVAGTSYRGMLEDRMDNIIKELKENKDYILLIDDIHTIMGNTSGSSGELSGIIANAMSDDDLQIIATTSFKGYKSIETNATLSRRFQKIVVEPTTIKETEDILFNVKKYYEKHHNVEYTDGSIENCVKLANKYINERYLPDSAIDVMDECGSDKKVYNESDNNLLELKKDFEMTERLRDSAMRRNNVVDGDMYNQESKRIKGKIIDLEKEMRENKKHTITKVSEGDVYKVVSEMVNIPITKLSVDEKKKFLDIENVLNANIIGQKDAIKKISQVIKRSRVGFDRKNKPTGAFLLIGPSGVGKTLLAKKLAEEIYGGENFLVRFDMSEYSDKTSVNKLIGTGAGYVGFDQGGLLTEMIKNKKHCVLLLDEIEKADPEVINLLLQVLDEASLTDNTGQKISFKNVIILMTSNIGAKKADMFAKGTGFMNNEEENKKTISEKELKKFFPPEFLNRLDSTVYFNELNDEDLKSIIELELNNLNGKFKEMGLSFEYTKPVRDYLFDIVVKERNFGARPINRAIQNEIENKIADIYLESEIESNYTFKISVSKGEIVIK